jgi:hypothetical protein
LRHHRVAAGGGGSPPPRGLEWDALGAIAQELQHTHPASREPGNSVRTLATGTVSPGELLLRLDDTAVGIDVQHDEAAVHLGLQHRGGLGKPSR